MIPPASRSMVQLRLDLGGSAAPAAALWELVGSEQRRAAIALLAALIAQSVVGDGVLDERVPLGGAAAAGARGQGVRAERA